jgi:hypothetical protein
LFRQAFQKARCSLCASDLHDAPGDDPFGASMRSINDFRRETAISIMPLRSNRAAYLMYYAAS